MSLKEAEVAITRTTKIEKDPESDTIGAWNRSDTALVSPKRSPMHRTDHNVNKLNRHSLAADNEEPLVDTTASIPLRSKRTERLQRRQQKKNMRSSVHSDVTSFLELPSELLLEVLSFLRPSDLFTLTRVNHSTKDYLESNEQITSESLIHWRYPILAMCFPRPVLFDHVDTSAHSALLSPTHQQRLRIHKVPYQHFKSADPQNTCSCMTCVLAWNNLSLAVDLAHWQTHLDSREPIPMVARGTRPQWNLDLVEVNAQIVNNAIRRPLWYARILQAHLNTTVKTIVRQAAIRRKNRSPIRDVPASNRLFHMSGADVASETDAFMQRSGPPSFEFPFTRDNYYTLASYLPNRRWDEGKWIYYGDLHERDVAWAKMVADREAQQMHAGSHPTNGPRDPRPPQGVPRSIPSLLRDTPLPPKVPVDSTASGA